MKLHASKQYILTFLAVLIGFAANQWSRSRYVEPYDERKIQMPEHEELSESLAGDEPTSWQKYRMRKRLGLEGPASPESMLITDMLQSCKSQESAEHVDDGKPVE